MSSRRNLLKKPRKLWGLCKAPVCAPNAATHKTGYCDFHHVEYAAAKKRHNDMRYNFKMGRTSRVPPDWSEYVRSISFAPESESCYVMDERAIAVLCGLINDLRRAHTMVETGERNFHLFREALERAIKQAQTLLPKSHSDQLR